MKLHDDNNFHNNVHHHFHNNKGIYTIEMASSLATWMGEDDLMHVSIISRVMR